MDFGTELKIARERRGLTLQQIAASTKISVGVLGALERNDFSRLPGGIFTRAFIRAYAAEVGLDPEQTLQHFLAETVDEEPPPSARRADTYAMNEPGERERFANMLLWLILLAVSAAVIYLLLHFWRQPSDTHAETAAPAASIAPPTARTTGTREGPAVDTPVLAPRPAAARPDTLVLDIAPTGECWVVAIADGEKKVAQLMHQGDHETVRAQDEIFLDIGDAATFGFMLAGRPGRSLGSSGERVKVTITRENLTSYLRS
ncbi:MAG: DUF4115 domain-containing protein [Acidobacteria bacterium]|nr:DUF4115 domain-containing protein [Acidobacteriota bacterium]